MMLPDFAFHAVAVRAGWKPHEDLAIERRICEGGLCVELMRFPSIACDEGEECANGGIACDGRERLVRFVVDPINLREALHQEARLVTKDSPSRAVLALEDPFAADDAVLRPFALCESFCSTNCSSSMAHSFLHSSASAQAMASS